LPTVDNQSSKDIEKPVENVVDLPLVEETAEEKKKREEKLFEKKKAKSKKLLRKINIYRRIF